MCLLHVAYVYLCDVTRSVIVIRPWVLWIPFFVCNRYINDTENKGWCSRIHGRTTFRSQLLSLLPNVWLNQFNSIQFNSIQFNSMQSNQIVIAYDSPLNPCPECSFVVVVSVAVRQQRHDTTRHGNTNNWNDPMDLIYWCLFYLIFHTGRAVSYLWIWLADWPTRTNGEPELGW